MGTGNGLVVSVWGKSGAGISVTTVNTALTMVEKYKVGLIGGRKDYGSVQHYLGMEISPAKSLKIALDTKDEEEILACFTKHGNLSVLSLANTEDCMCVDTISAEAAQRILDAGRNFDYLFVDCPQYFTEAFTGISCQEADYILQVIRPTIQDVAFMTAQKAIIDGLELQEKIIPVANCDENLLSLSKIEKKLKIKFFQVLPYSVAVKKSTIDGIPVSISKSRFDGAGAYREGIRKICNRLEMGRMIREGIT